MFVKKRMWEPSSWNSNVAHDTVTETDASESMIPLSNVLRNRTKPEPYRTENRRQRLYLRRASNLASIMTQWHVTELITTWASTTWHILPRRSSLLSKCRTVSGYTGRYNSTHGLEKSTALSTLIFTKLKRAQQHYVQITFKILHSNGTINVEMMNGN
jgi:hypothetical protein